MGLVSANNGSKYRLQLQPFVLKPASLTVSNGYMCIFGAPIPTIGANTSILRVLVCMLLLKVKDKIGLSCILNPIIRYRFPVATRLRFFLPLRSGRGEIGYA